ncbi:MAG: tetratricopeptide repeat protein [Halieaceae bacterium]|nr:tetratricopeptide repeat protein [Halieaceae bacterium]
MQPATDATVLGDFTDARFSYAGVTSRFFRQESGFWVETDNADGELQKFRIEYTFGVDPLQQYLVAFPGGRLQALGIAWDTRPASEGGQRWFHLYPDDALSAADPLHWTGPYQNWNLQCAECHSTRLSKNYNPVSDSYATTWTEINVGCEACHGPGRAHVEAAEASELAQLEQSGFPVQLSERGAWALPEGEKIARRRLPLGRSLQVENCGRCHARRGTIGEYEYGKHLLATHRPALLQAPLYHPDGQILDEVYVYGSFIQSKMYQAGVVCSNCHEPHSNQLRAPGNAVCTQCHKSSAYEAPSHHHHAATSAGAACVGCHMPQQNYMVIDGRRDHSMRVPRPDLSLVIGTPNACTQCHGDRDNQWAVDTLRDWGVSFEDTSNHPARTMVLARRADGRAVPSLASLALAEDAAVIWRATAMSELGSFSNQAALDTAATLLTSEDPMLRWAAVSSLGMLSIQARYVALSPLIKDNNRAVRLEVARMLAEVPLEQIGSNDAARLNAIFEEYLDVLGQQADTPEGLLEMGVFLVARRLYAPAENAYAKAIRLNPQLVAAYLNQADLLRLQGRDAEGRALLQDATGVAPGEAAVWYALGLLETRQGDKKAALQHLARAAELEETGIRYRYVYGIARQDAGDTQGALDTLRPLLREAPENPDLLLALATYAKAAGLVDEARRHGRRLQALLPDDPGVRKFAESL